MDKPAENDHPIHDLLRRRWSPRAFAPRALPPAQVRSLLEAARWAPSSYNRQPWRFLVATREDTGEFARMLGCLVPGNRAWAGAAPLLVLAVAQLAFDDSRPNRHAAHDLGLAVGQLVLQATALGLFAHQMAGIEADEIRARYALPEGFEPMTAIAIGHAGDPAALPDRLREMEHAPRTRRPLDDFVFAGKWGRSAAL